MKTVPRIVFRASSTKAELSGVLCLNTRKNASRGTFHNLSILNIWLSTQHNTLETLNHFNIINDENLAPTNKPMELWFRRKHFFSGLFTNHVEFCVVLYVFYLITKMFTRAFFFTPMFTSHSINFDITLWLNTWWHLGCETSQRRK